MTAPARKPLFTAFVRRLGIVLEPGQLVLAKVAFDGLDPCDLEGQERELARQVFGDVEAIPAGARDIVAAVCGRASGKTTLAHLRLLHLSLTVPLGLMRSGQVALVPIVAPKLKDGRECLSMVRGTVQDHMPALLRGESSESLLLERPDGRQVSIELVAATAGGGAVRGRNIPACFLEECAFFRDSDYKVNDEEVFNSAVPRLLPGGQMLLMSSPWLRSGLLFKMWRDNFGRPLTALVAHAATLTMRTDARVVEIARREQQRDPDNFRIEFGAQFLDASSSQFFDEATITACIDDALVLGAKPPGGAVVTHGGDFGFVHDSSALATAHRLGASVVVADLCEVRPAPGAPLQPSRVVADFAKRMLVHGGDCLMVDSHYREAVREHLETHGLYLLAAPEGQAGKAESYVRLRSMMREGRVRLPRDERLLAQLRAVTAKPTPGGGLSVSSPRGPGGHGDLVSALVLAVWQQHGAEVPRDTSALSSAERERERCEAGERAYLERLSRPGERDWLADETEGDDGGLFS